MSKASWYALLAEFAGYEHTYFLAEGLDSGNALNGSYYDGEFCRYRLAQYFGTTSPYYDQADRCNTIYKVNYGDANSWNLPGYWVFPHGLAYRYLVRGDTAALTALNSLMSSAAYMVTGDLNGEGRTLNTRHEISREFGYCILGYIQLATCQTLTAAQEARRDYCFESSLLIIDDWSSNIGQPPANQRATYFRPFMGSRTAHALVDYYENVATESQKSVIIDKLSQLATYAWDNCWDAAGRAHNYTDRIGGGGDSWAAAEDGDPQPDLSMLIAPWYAWLWSVTGLQDWKDKAEQIFAGGESVYSEGFWQSGAYLGTQSASNPNGKHINQQLVWGAKYWDYVEVTFDEVPQTPPPTDAIVSTTSSGGNAGGGRAMRGVSKKLK